MPDSMPTRKERFIVIATNDCAMRDCIRGENYHLETREETASLVATFNIQYSHMADLEVKFNTVSVESAELRTHQTELKDEIATLYKKLDECRDPESGD